jgi:DNA polymerase-3 subunit alpha
MDQIPTYVYNKKHPGAVKYVHPILENILDVTYGCMVYQEQVMQIVRDMAGYSMGQSDLVRRAMAHKKHDVMEKERVRFVEGCLKNNISEKISNSIFDQMMDFASYAFNKSHAACYAVVAYQTGWLKYYYPVEFMAAMLNSFLDSPGKVAGYVVECKNMGIKVLPPDINESYQRFTVKDKNIRFGLVAIKNAGAGAALSIIEEREKNGPFTSFENFCSRLDTNVVNKRCVESFIKAGAFDSLSIYRSRLMKVYEKLLENIASDRRNKFEGQLSLLDFEEEQNEIPVEYPEIAEFPVPVLLGMEKEMLGLYVSGHPLMEYEQKLAEIRTIKASDIIPKDEESEEEDYTIDQNEVKDNMEVVTGGIINGIKKKVTKNNALMAFVDLEDMYGIMELLIFPKIYDKYSTLLFQDNIVIVKGRLSIREDDSPKIIVESVSPISSMGIVQGGSHTRAVSEGNDQGIDEDLIFTIEDKTKVKAIKAFVRIFPGRKHFKVESGSGETLFQGNVEDSEDVISELKWVMDL